MTMSSEQKQAWKDRGIGALFSLTASLLLALITIIPDRVTLAGHEKDIPQMQSQIIELKIAQAKSDERWEALKETLKKMDSKLDKLTK